MDPCWFALIFCLFVVLCRCLEAASVTASVEEDVKKRSLYECDVEDVLLELREDITRGVVRWRHCMLHQKGLLNEFQTSSIRKSGERNVGSGGGPSSHRCAERRDGANLTFFLAKSHWNTSSNPALEIRKNFCGQ